MESNNIGVIRLGRDSPWTGKKRRGSSAIVVPGRGSVSWIPEGCTHSLQWLRRCREKSKLGDCCRYDQNFPWWFFKWERILQGKALAPNYPSPAFPTTYNWPTTDHPQGRILFLIRNKISQMSSQTLHGTVFPWQVDSKNSHPQIPTF